MKLNFFKNKKIKEESTTKKGNYWIENIKTFFIAILIALTLRTFAFEPFSIPSGSMKPTLLEGDYLFVSKYFQIILIFSLRIKFFIIEIYIV